MSDELKPKSGTMNGRLWGARARDWAELTESAMRPVYDTAFDRTGVKAATRYLDIGCGAGMAAQMAAERGAKVSGIDAAEAMLAIAKTRVPGGDFRSGDLEELPFPERTFDVVTGFNAFQFAANPAVALKEARRVTKPDGVIAVVTWGDPQGMEMVAVVTSLRPLMPPPPPGALGPFALSDQTALRKFASDAGLRPGDVFDVEAPFAYPDEATALRAFNASGVAARARENSSETAVTEAHAKAIAPFRRADGSYRIKASFRCLLARP